MEKLNSIKMFIFPKDFIILEGLGEQGKMILKFIWKCEQEEGLEKNLLKSKERDLP